MNDILLMVDQNKTYLLVLKNPVTNAVIIRQVLGHLLKQTLAGLNVQPEHVAIVEGEIAKPFGVGVSFGN